MRHPSTRSARSEQARSVPSRLFEARLVIRGRVVELRSTGQVGHLPLHNCPYAPAPDKPTKPASTRAPLHTHAEDAASQRGQEKVVWLFEGKLVELRSAGPLRLRSGLARGGGRHHVSARSAELVNFGDERATHPPVHRMTRAAIQARDYRILGRAIGAETLGGEDVEGLFAVSAMPMLANRRR